MEVRGPGVGSRARRAPQEGEDLPASASSHGRPGGPTWGRWGRERDTSPEKNPGPGKQLVLAPMAWEGGPGLDL